MTDRIWLRLVGTLSTMALAVVLVGCNDAPSIVGSELIPGTSVLYSATTDSLPLLNSDSTVHNELPLVNATYFLLGSTPKAEARVFMELLNYPREIAGDSLFNESTFDVSSANLQIYPQSYSVGDTADKTLSFNVFELRKFWPANLTWDSIWSATGTTDYYSPADKPIATYSGALTGLVPDSTVISVPFDQALVKRWLVNSRDTALRKQIYGFVLVPNGMRQIRQFRNIESGVQKMRLRVIARSRKDTTTHIYNIDLTVAGFVNDADAPVNSLTIQGSRNVRAKMTLQLDTIPHDAVVMGADLRLTVDQSASTIGTSGRDDKISLQYQPPVGQIITIDSRSDSSGVYRFANIGPLIDLIRKNKLPASLVLRPTSDNEFWRMNRLVFHGTQAAVGLRPRLSLIYARPTEKK